MNLCIATYATGNYACLCDITDGNKLEYSQRHGYGFERNHDEAFNTGFPFFDRHRWHVSLMQTQQWDWFYFVDADAIFTNLLLKLEDLILPQDHLIFPLDAVMVQAGGFLARNSEPVLRFFKSLLERQAHPMQSDQIEMEAIIPQFDGYVRFLPQRVLGSYEYGFYPHLGGNYLLAKDRNGNDGQWHRGDFVFHAPGMTMPQKAETLRSHLEQVIR
jgi:hypothetical protein